MLCLRLHVQCAQISIGHACKGNFTCVACRIKEMGAEGDPTRAFLDEVTQMVVLELALGREGTATTHQSFVSLTGKWVAEKRRQGLTKILSPTESLASFKQFASWMVLDADRARSMRTTMRAAAGYFEGAAKPNFTKDASVKKLLNELDDIHGTEAQPMTHCTRRMLREMLYTVIPQRFARAPLLAARESVAVIQESVGCLRATESLQAIEKHGLCANDVFLLRDQSTGEVSVELKLHDSKTGYNRWINMSGETQTSHIQVEQAYRRLVTI